MGCIFLEWLIVASSLLLPQLSFDATQAPEGALKITTRTVAPGTGLSWGEGLLSYKGQDYPLTFEARGLFRNVDAEITAAELSGQVFNLKSPEDIAGNYQMVEAKEAESGTGSRADTGWHAEHKEQDGCPRHRALVGGGLIKLQRPGLPFNV